MVKKFTLLFVVILIAVAGVYAQSLSVVVPQLSPIATDTYTKIIQAIADVEGKTVSVQAVPFARAVYMVESKQADIESSLIINPDKAKWAALKYDFANAELLKIVFVLYTNKAKPISVADIKSGKAKGYKLESDPTQVDYFPVPVAATSNSEASLKKVDSGLIDGYLFSQGSGDVVLKRLGLKNITRQYYDSFSAGILLQKGGRGGPIDSWISDGLAKLKANGKYQEIVGPYAATASKYIEWQP